jgi:transcriptional regulator with GAF, ATPase, and Fis domain
LDMISLRRPDVVLLDIILQGEKTGIELAKQLSALTIPFVYLSANSNESILRLARATQPSAFLVKPFREKDVLITLQMTLYKHAHSVEACLRREQALQISISDSLSQQVEWETKLLEVARQFQSFIPFDFLLMGISNGTQPKIYGFFRIGFDEYQVLGTSEFIQMTGCGLAKFNSMVVEAFTLEPGIVNESDFGVRTRKSGFTSLVAKTFKVESNLLQSIATTRGGTFLLSFFSKTNNVYQSSHYGILQRLSKPLSVTLDRMLAFEEIEKLSEQLQRENNYLQEEVKTTANFEEIIGTSRSLLHVFDLVTQVSRTDSSVVILGESGTGKELIARSIHNLSPRKSKLLVKINCAALPSTLIESELFGHEKGAFTGAYDKRIGKFELADGGTIFLDEIGEMPMELQSKLLRVLQEKEIERVGGKGPIKTDVRIIAATNRNLEKEVAEGKFRLDLYYRLSVFPIALPALRERREDIPLLALFFAQKFCKKMGKTFNGINEKEMNELVQYNWPGNIRELGNVIEQSVILNDGVSPLEWGRPLLNRQHTEQNNEPVFSAKPRTLSDVKHLQQETEREYILSILRKANGRIRGKNGAAELLNLKPTTLESRMEKLGINKVDV